MESSLIINNWELFITNFMHQVLPDVLKYNPSYCLSVPNKENLLFHQPTPFIMILLFIEF